MQFNYQFGFDFGLFVFWFTVSKARFAAKVAPLILRPGQESTITSGEVLPFFNTNFIFRDGLRLYRAVPLEE